MHGDAGAPDKIVSRWVLGLLTVGGLGLRLVYVAQPLRHDETMMWLQFARRPLAEALSHYELATNHLLYTLLLYVPTRTLGDAPWVLRLPALVAGVLLIPATYQAAARLYGRAAAPLAAAMVAGSSLMVEYSANARGYGLMTLGFLLAVACAARLLPTPRLGGWLTWAVPVGLGLYAVPLMALPLAALLAWIVLEAARTPDPRTARETIRGVGVGVAAAAALAAVLYAPVVVTLGGVGLANAVAHAAGPVRSWAEAMPGVGAQATSIWDSWHRNCHAPVALALGASALFAVVVHHRVGRQRISLAAVVLAFLLPLGALAWVRPRIALFAAPLYYAAAAAGFASVIARFVEERRVAVAAPAVAIGLFLLLGFTELRSRHVYWSSETGAARDAVQLADYLATVIRPGDVLLHARAPVAYHLEKRGVPVRDANVVNERGTITPVYYYGPPPEVPPPTPRRLFLVADHARRDRPPGRRATDGLPAVAGTLAFRGFPSLVSREWQMVQDVNEASVWVLTQSDGNRASTGRRPST